MDDSAEARLLEAARRGSLEAFGELIRRWQPPVAELCLGVTGEPEEAARLTEAVFRRLATALDGPGPLETVRPAVFRETWRALNDSGWFATSPDDAPILGPEAALPGMSRRRAALFLLRERARLSAGEIATVLGVSVGSAGVVLDRLGTGLSEAQEAAVAELASRKPARPDPAAVARIREVVAADWEARPIPIQPAAAAAATAPRSRRTALVTALGIPLAAGAAALSALLLVPGSPLALTREPDLAPPAALVPTSTPDDGTVVITVTPTPGDEDTRTPAASRTPTSTPTVRNSGAIEPSPRPTDTPTATGTATPTPEPPTATPTPTEPSTATPTPTPTPTLEPCVPQLAPNVEKVTMQGGALTTTVTVFNGDTCGEAPFTASAGDTPWIFVNPIEGVIPPFESTEVTISLVNPPERGTGVVTITGPANQLTIVVEYRSP